MGNLGLDPKNSDKIGEICFGFPGRAPEFRGRNAGFPVKSSTILQDPGRIPGKNIKEIKLWVSIFDNDVQTKLYQIFRKIMLFV